MAAFGVMVEDDEKVGDCVSKIESGLLDHNIVRNPFSGLIVQYGMVDGGKKKRLIVMVIKPVYQNFSVFGWIPVFLSLYFFGMVWWILLPSFFLISLGVFWSRHFYAFIMKKSLKKHGYKGDVKILSAADCVGLLIEEGAGCVKLKS